MKIKRIGIGCCVLICVCCIWLLGRCDREDFDGLSVSVLDVGQSDCTLLTVGEAVVMIDAGTLSERHAVQAALSERGIEKIDCLVLTHLHEDHIGNARMVIETYTVGALLVPPVDSDETDFRFVREAAERRDVPVRAVHAGDAMEIGEMALDVLQAGEDATDPNNSSIALMVTFGQTKFLFTGDNEQEGEERLLASASRERLQCDFMKAGHHGSANATGEALLAVAGPAHVAISCGAYNSYGFPDKEMLSRLRKIGAEWHRTDIEGTLCYRSDGKQVWFDE